MLKDVNKLVEQAIDGDRKALGQVLMEIKEMVYNLSLKMLLYPHDAEDATQEILIRIVTHLSTFKGKSQFSTWVYRVSSNYLLTVKGKKSAEFAMDFQEYANFIDTEQSDNIKTINNDGELLLLEEEVKVSCTHGLLICLAPEDRLVYILTEILDLSGKDGAAILDISPDSFRKKLSRSRSKIRNFMNKKCGLVNPSNPCRCSRKIDFLVNQNVIDPKNLRFAQFTQRSIDLINQIGDLERSVAIYRSTPDMPTPPSVLKTIKEVMSIE